MKIINHPKAIDNIHPSRKAVAEPRPEAAGPPPSGDRVTLSPQARELRDARRIASGTYRIDADAVADKMVRDAFPDDS